MKNVILLITAGIIAGCSSAPQSSQKIGMANPASVYCEQSGGTLNIKDTADGQVGYCTLPDGSKIEEWALYRRDHK
ncbi:DUF333 domain-containing protein [Morganella psychrotolerans]|uniref:putative hemolysin n=1 Tax=Morganella psychrotolerans TaxID=368603 RepID=UPI0039B04EBD